MSRRLEHATEDALLTGGRAGRRAIEDTGFSEELKSRLMDKIAEAQFQSEHRSTIAAVGLDAESLAPHPAGGGLLVSAKPWTGEETTADTVLRMLDDSRKPLSTELRGKTKTSDPTLVDLRLQRRSTQSPGQRMETARDKAMTYTGIERGAYKGLSDNERKVLRQEFRDRFTADARAMPTSFLCLTALANERIEDAIARGQFRNIPRGPGIERNSRADNPFIDTTEYILNGIIHRQDIVPPWIEKQQELMCAAKMFRVRLRNDWRRHAARSITSRGGSLQAQMARAHAYALAEQAYNPRLRDIEHIPVPTNTTDDSVMTKLRGPPLENDGATETNRTEADVKKDEATSSPFRDPRWEAAERSCMESTVKNLNALARSYNLMAPELAKKPYFSVDRELRACFADVAPSLADTIRGLAARPPKSRLADTQFTISRRFLNRVVTDGRAARVYDSKAPNYGLKEMWRDFWKRSA